MLYYYSSKEKYMKSYGMEYFGIVQPRNTFFYRALGFK